MWHTHECRQYIEDNIESQLTKSFEWKVSKLMKMIVTKIYWWYVEVILKMKTLLYSINHDIWNLAIKCLFKSC